MHSQPTTKRKIYKPKEYLAFGDSFVKMLLHCENIKYYKYKGKTIRGIAKQDDPDRKKIMQIVKKENKSCIFIFGQVDFNLVRYYKRVRDEEYTCDALVNYIDWLSTLNRQIFVIGIFPSPIKKQNIIRSLIKYGTIPAQQKIDEKKIFEEYERSDAILTKWNDILKKGCEKHGFTYLDLFPTGSLSEEFLDLSDVNLHLRYEPVLRVMQKNFNLTIDWKKVADVEKEYEKEKEARIIKFNVTKESKEETVARSKVVTERWKLANQKL